MRADIAADRRTGAGPPDHPLRYALTNEVHARPFAVLRPPECASHLAVVTGEAGAEDERARLAELCARYTVNPPPEDASHFSADFGPFRLKWERHTEFSTYTVFRQGPFEEPFAKPALSLIPPDWLDGVPGERLAAVHVAIEARDAPARPSDALAADFVLETLCASLVGEGAATAWTDFRIHQDGFGRILIRDEGLTDRRAGRLVQRLLEIETYRTFALLALPVAREIAPHITRIERELAEIADAIGKIGGLDDERRLLDRLTGLSAEIERLSAASNYRFTAARAYYALVKARLQELRERRVEGFQTIAEFMDRRLAPAMRTCESVAARQEDLSRRLTRAANLLRTRVDVAVEAQNRDLLASMDRRARLQLRLQQTVEGLSVVAISYYLVGLAAYAVKAAEAAGLPLSTDLAVGIAIVPVVALVWYMVRRVKRMVVRRHADEA
jgi:uncharacterized membrane-anchored protein